MKKLGEVLTIIGIALFFIAPSYQFFDARLKNESGDGEIVYGDNPVFRNLLGVKTLRYHDIDGYWDYEGTKLETTQWMQEIGFEKNIYWGYSKFNDFRSNSNEIQVVLIIALRLIIKLSIPLIFFIPGLILKKKYP